jgi:heme/copper-type cytochrome/quinol oxidase subunit 2
MTRLRSSTFALRAAADKSSFGEARSATLWVRRGLRTAVTTAAAVMIGGSSTVLACPACFGAEETSMVDGTKIGVLVMLAITLAVQGGFAGFFFYLRQRAKRNAEVELEAEWSELQRASRTS